MIQTTHTIDVNEIKGMLHVRIRSVLQHLLPNGTFHKNQFHVGDIHGSKGKSLVVDVSGPKIGLWQDFATGESGDILTLWAAHYGMDTKHDFPKVMESVQKWLGINPVKSSVATTASNYKSSAFVPPESEKSTESFTKTLAGEWHYLSEDGKPIVTVRRYDTSDGKKEFLPYDVLRNKHGLPEVRPLYNLPGIAASQTVVIVEGEKAAQALIDIGICATTAMGGANAPIEKTDWSPLFKKDVIIWPDNDEPGKQYAKLLAERLKTEILSSLGVVIIPKDKPNKWDAADAVGEGLDIHKLFEKRKIILKKTPAAYDGDHWFGDKSPTPDDIIDPRILTPHGLLVFGGAPKVGKSDLLLAWLANMSSGLPFLGMRPSRPLKIFYLQTEVEYHYFKERMHALQLDPEARKLVGKNLVATPQCQVLLDKEGVELMHRAILCHFPKGDVDIIAIDPLRQVFDGGENKLSENDNGAMNAFLHNRIGALRDSINPTGAVILIHHTKKLTATQIEEEGFNAFAGAGSLRCCFTTGILMYQPDEKVPHFKLKFELRNGKRIPDQNIRKVNEKWCEIEGESEQLTSKDHSQRLDAERRRKHHVILQIIYSQAERGHVYTINQFCEKFEGKSGLGSKDTIRNRIDTLANTGHIKFFSNAEDYGLISPARTRYGYLCVEGMKLITKNTDADATGEFKTQIIYPTDFKHGEGGALLPVENPKTWVYYTEKGEATWGL